MLQIKSIQELERDAVLQYTAKMDCQNIDKNIKDIDVRVTEVRKNILKPPTFFDRIKQTDYYVNYINGQRVLPVLEKIRKKLKEKFITNKCEFNLEIIKLNESADVLSEKFTEFDQDVLKPSSKTNTYLLIGGSLVLLLGIYIIIKK